MGHGHRLQDLRLAGYFYLKLSYAPELFEAPGSEHSRTFAFSLRQAPVCGVKTAAPLWHLELAAKEATAEC